MAGLLPYGVPSGIGAALNCRCKLASSLHPSRQPSSLRRASTRAVGNGAGSSTASVAAGQKEASTSSVASGPVAYTAVDAANAAAAAAAADAPAAEIKVADSGKKRRPGGAAKKGSSAGGLESHAVYETPQLVVTKPLPRVLMLHTGGTLGMDPAASFEADRKGVHLKSGTGGVYAGSRGSGLRPGALLQNVLTVVPEVNAFANLELRVVYNKDSSNVGPAEWKQLAKLLHKERDNYDAFLVVHGTDTLAYTASALSLMLVGFKKPIVITGSQLPLAMPRSDARQNIIDSVTCLTSFFNPPHVRLQEVAVCFGGRLMRGNRVQKVHSSFYQAFDSVNYPHLANLGVEIDWDLDALLEPQGVYRPRFELDPRVIRIPIIPGCDPQLAYGDLMGRGVRGIVLEAFGVGNMPDTNAAGWLPWLKEQRRKGLYVYLASQCLRGQLQPELYKSGMIALKAGVEAGPQMTPECAVVKMMQCLKYPDIPLGVPLAGEM